MKVTVEYETREEITHGLNADNAFSALRDIYNLARNQLKHGEAFKHDETLEQIKQIAAEVISREEE